ncbi:ABC transporter substrate-binding protein [Propionispira raffinosivorans]|uniref:ABC transporter substrate-binding protein n=1 Tax=Propionispira raffinosivorans TaxID=86959 RepID=UPI00035FBC20|nr:ABC transporter substrate-binding protein [Propionispira raffinosivorans]
MKRNIIIVLLFSIVCLIFSGCGNAVKLEQNTGYKVVDSHGQVLEMLHKPQHIVSLTLCSDEILLSLVDKDCLASVSSLAANPSISNVAVQAEGLAMLENKSIEAILAKNPDLIIVGDWLPDDFIVSLRELNVPVYVYKTPQTIAEVRTLVLDMGSIVGETEKSKKIVADMDAVLTQITNKVQLIPENQKKMVMAMSFMGCYGGKGTMLDDIYKKAGVINGAALAGLEKNDVLAKEQIVAMKPDILMIPTWDYEGKDIREFKNNILTDPALQQVPAIMNQKFIQIDDKYTYSTSQYVVYAVKNIFEAVYEK